MSSLNLETFINADELLKGGRVYSIPEIQLESLRQEGYEVYEQHNIDSYLDDVKSLANSHIQKGETISDSIAELIEKAKKDIGRLQKVVITDKNGHKRTVYIDPNKDNNEQKETKSPSASGTVQKKGDLSKEELTAVADKYDELSHINKIKFERQWEKQFGEKFSGGKKKESKKERKALKEGNSEKRSKEIAKKVESEGKKGEGTLDNFNKKKLDELSDSDIIAAAKEYINNASKVHIDAWRKNNNKPETKSEGKMPMNEMKRRLRRVFRDSKADELEKIGKLLQNNNLDSSDAIGTGFNAMAISQVLEKKFIKENNLDVPFLNLENHPEKSKEFARKAVDMAKKAEKEKVNTLLSNLKNKYGDNLEQETGFNEKKLKSILNKMVPQDGANILKVPIEWT